MKKDQEAGKELLARFERIDISYSAEEEFFRRETSQSHLSAAVAVHRQARGGGICAEQVGSPDLPR